MATVTNTIKLPDGTVPGRVDVVIELVASETGKAAGWVTASDVTLGAVVRPTVTGGVWTASLTPNADVTPSGSVYRVTEYVDGVRYIHHIEVDADGGSLFDLLVDPPASLATAASEVYADAAVAAHAADVADAHGASAVSVLDTAGYFSGADVEAVLAEVGADAVARTTQLSTMTRIGRASPMLRFAALGDSITADGGWRLPATSRATGLYNWHLFAQILADSRVLYQGCYATAGYTTAEILATHVPQLIASDPRPDYCVVLCGHNNLGSQFTEHEQIVSDLLGAGIVPILCTPTPYATSGLLRHVAFVRRLAAKYGLPLLDLYSVLIDHATGAWLSAYTRDTVHPTQAGAWVMGQALADLFVELVPHNSWASWLPQADVHTVAGTGSSAAVMISGPTGSYPNGYSALAGGHAATPTYTSGTAGFGYKMTMTRSGSDLIVGKSFGSSLAAGHRLVVAFKLSTDVVSSSAVWRMGLGMNVNSQTPSPILDIGRSSATNFSYDLADKVCVFELVVPATWSASPTSRCDFNVANGDGSISVEQFAVWQLDLMSVPAGI